MDPNQLKKIVIPALGVSALILVVGIVFLMADSGSGGSSGTSTSTPVLTGDFESNARTEGMSTVLPPVDAPEFRPLADGIKIWDVKVGEGDEVTPGGRVKMHYVGWRLDGFVFDSSLRTGTPLNMPLVRLIPGWQKGVPGMKPGGIRRIFIPSALAYGSGGGGKDIPPNSDLVFEMKLLPQ